MLILLALACGPTAPALCTDDSATLKPGLTCGDAKVAGRYLRVLAGHPLPTGSIARSIAATSARPGADAWLTAIKARAKAIESTPGLEGAVLRAEALHAELAGTGLLDPTLDAELRNLLTSTVSVWSTDDEEKLVLTETDIEGWIQYASLANEIRGQGVLRLSIAEKAQAYRIAAQRFEQGDRAEQIALIGLGVVWEGIREAWQAAPYAKQQAFITSTPLPESSATGAAYVEAVLEADLVTGATNLHRVLGPLYFRDGAGTFQ